MNAPKPPLPRPPLFMLVFISMFGVIGLAVLIFLWSISFHEFGAPPLLFRVVGSCIAIAFMAFGFGLPLSALRQSRHDDRRPDDPIQDQPPGNGSTPIGSTPRVAYKCPHCGAGLGRQEVSPSGDAKCNYCHTWWNIHHSA